MSNLPEVPDIHLRAPWAKEPTVPEVLERLRRFHPRYAAQRVSIIRSLERMSLSEAETDQVADVLARILAHEWREHDSTITNRGFVQATPAAGLLGLIIVLLFFNALPPSGSSWSILLLAAILIGLVGAFILMLMGPIVAVHANKRSNEANDDVRAESAVALARSPRRLALAAVCYGCCDKQYYVRAKSVKALAALLADTARVGTDPLHPAESEWLARALPYLEPTLEEAALHLLAALGHPAALRPLSAFRVAAPSPALEAAALEAIAAIEGRRSAQQMRDRLLRPTEQIDDSSVLLRPQTPDNAQSTELLLRAPAEDP